MDAVADFDVWIPWLIVRCSVITESHPAMFVVVKVGMVVLAV